MGARRLDEEGLALLGVAIADADTVARRERKIVRVAGSECWWLTGAISGKGHGRFWFATGRVIVAHRFGFAQVHGVEALAALEIHPPRLDPHNLGSEVEDDTLLLMESAYQVAEFRAEHPLQRPGLRGDDVDR